MRGQHVVITGGTGALGRAVTAALVQRGAQIVIPVFRREEAPDLLTALGEHAAAVTLRDADLRDEAAVTDLLDSVPRLDALVHLVGGFAMGATEAFAVDDARAQLELNIMTAFIMIKHALRRMNVTGYGRIVTVGSRSAVQPTAQQAIYSAAKAGLVALTQAVAAETRGSDITANCVLPSILDTPQNRAAMGQAAASTWVQPASLAEVIAFLASPAAADVRGAAVPVYGGA